jgi:hypothetical protein
MTQYDAIPLADVLRDHINGEQIAHLTVSSHSMSPLLDAGDVIGLHHADPSQIERGDIITFIDPKNPQGLLTHRVAARQRDQEPFFLLTRGDRMLVFDRPLDADAVIGQVVWRIRNGRKLRLDQGSGAWLSKKLGAVAELERRWISGVPFEVIAHTCHDVSAANELVRSRRENRSARFARAVGRMCSRLLAAGVLFIASPETTAEAESS